MIVQQVPRPMLATKLPSYFGTLLTSDEIIGVGEDSIFVIDDSLQIIRYDRALRAGTLANATTSSHRSSLGYSEILRQLVRLAKTPEGDDLGRIRPSEGAIGVASKVAFRMLSSAADMTPPSDVSTDRDGDIRVLWERGDRTMELVCPYEPSQRAYIYYSDGTQYAIAYDLSVYRLRRLLAWLAGAIPTFPR